MDHADPLPKAHERRLATAAAEGDSDAVGQLYDAYEKRLYGYCSRITGNPEDAADATQEAFCNVIQRLPGMDTTTLNFGAYLFTAARNACLDLLKSQGRFQATGEVPEDPFAVAPLETDPERALLTSDQQRAAREANAQLPEKQRAVLAMREVAELSYDEIAAALDMNQNSVAQLISRARLNFQKQLRAGSVVLTPLGTDGQRAMELTAARMDGQIKGEDLAWLNTHLAENESSRINAEAMQESTKLYRAIGPIVALAGLKQATVARAAESTTAASAGSPALPASNASGGSDSPQEEAAEGAPAASHRRRGFAAAAVVALLLILLVATTGGERENARDMDAAPQPTSEVAAPVEGSESRKAKPSSARTGVPAGRDRTQSQLPGVGTQRSKGGRSESKKKRKDEEASHEAPPSSLPPAGTAPDPPPAPTPSPPTPGGGGGGGIPGGPGDLCSAPPCTPPPPVP